jgi:hypothetical protein
MSHMDYDTMCQAIFDACDDAVGTELNVYDEFPKSADIPALIIKSDDQNAIGDHTSFSPISNRWRLLVMIFVGQVDELSATKTVRELITPGSDLRTAIEDIDFNGYGWVRIDKASVGETALGTGRCKYARLALDVQN